MTDTIASIRAILDHEGCEIRADGSIRYRDHTSRGQVSIDIEDVFGIADISEEEAEQCVTVADWVEVVVGKMK